MRLTFDLKSNRSNDLKSGIRRIPCIVLEWRKWWNLGILNCWFWIHSVALHPSLQCQLYTNWEICEACEKMTMAKSSYYYPLEVFGVTNTTIWRILNLLLPPLKCSFQDHLWEDKCVIKSTGKKYRSDKTYSNQEKFGGIIYLLKDWETYIVKASEIKGAQGIPRDAIGLESDIQKGLHGICKRSTVKEIKANSQYRYARRVVYQVNY